MMSLRTDISDLQHDSACQLVLQIQVVILHIGSTDVAVKSENVTFQLAATRRIENCLAGNDRPTGVHCRNDLRWPNRVVRGTRIIVRRVG